MSPPERTIILSGIVGSHAYGLNNEQSDVDKLGVFVYPTTYFWSLDKLPETKVTTKPDSCYHEIEKFLRLCLNCNPTLLELLWLPAELYIKNSMWGEFLINLREKFLSTGRVTQAYGGYAHSQMQKIRTSNSHKRFKHAMHCFRLLRQGKELLSTGHLTLNVSNSEEYRLLESRPIDEMESLFQKEHAEFHAIKSCLPVEPDKNAINYYLCRIRSGFLI